jgi:23S rRNA (cytidine1920-2'-O)/16S rRNA (cytidine1409-2'-O)-methyltransferase
MPRLDTWLVESGMFLSRQTAKRAIRDGLVTVDGKPAKPSTQISGREVILVLSDTADHPIGYSKLKKLNELHNGVLVRPGIYALDIGSSAGGFLQYLAENEVKVIGVEVSETFIENLQRIVDRYESVSIVIDDAFFLDPSELIGPRTLDLLLIDVTTDPDGTLGLIERFAPFLRTDGWLVAAFKTQDQSDLERIQSTMRRLGFTISRSVVLNPSVTEIHILAICQ